MIGLERLHGGGPVSLAVADCLPLRGRHLNCSVCVDVCPVGALRLTSPDRASAGCDRMSLSLGETCDGCGRCATQCPTGAIVVGFDDAGLTSGPVDCRRVPRKSSPYGARRASCLGGIGVDRILTGARSGRGSLVLLDRGWCGDCPAGGGDAAPWSGFLALAREILEQAGVPEKMWPRVESRPLPKTIALDREPVVEVVAEGRRGFIRGVGRGQPASSGLFADLPPPSRAPLAAEGRRRRLQLAATLAKTFGGRVAAALSPVLSVNDDCMDHGACVAFCPTGALRLEAGAMLFESALCVACGACVDACREGAVSLAGRGGKDEIVQLRRSVEDEEQGSCAKRRALAREGAALRKMGFTATETFERGGGHPQG